MINNNSDILGPSLSQGQVFRKQQQSRMLNNNDVVTHNAKNKQNGKTNIAPAMAAISATLIEPFSQNTDNGSKNYKPLSLQDIEGDDSVIKSVNDNQNAQTRQSILSYSNVSQNLNNFQENVTSDAKAYNNIKKTPGLLNKPYLTSDNKTIMVNNAGVVNTLTGAKENIPINPGIDISKSIQNPQPAINYFQVENSETASNIGVYDKQLSSKKIDLPKDNSGYKLEGENVFVIYPYPNTPDEINKNMTYIGAFNISGMKGLNLDEHMPTETTLNCLQRAVDKGFSWCGMTTYGNINRSGKHEGGGGKCMIGNLSHVSDYAYRVRIIPQTGSNTILKFPEGQGYNSLTFAADGVLHAGYNVNYAWYKNHDKFLTKLTKEFNNELDPVYGGTINNLVAYYAYNQGRWDSLTNFPGNPNPIAEPSGTLNTMRNYDVDVPHLGWRQETIKSWWGGTFTYNVPYIYTTKETRQQLAASNVPGGNMAYINYKCGKKLTKTPIVKSGVNAGEGFNVDCSDLYSKYPSFTLELNDEGILTITNNASISEINADSKVKEFKMSIEYTNVTLSNKQPYLLNKPRPDWVNGSINNGRSLTSNSNSNHSILENQWISSPKGFCRLILKPGGVLDLEYSEENVIQDITGNLVGRDSSSVALYKIENVNTSGLGESASIDINGAVNPYPPNMVQYDNTYTKVQDYISVQLDPKNTSATSTSRQQCEDKCNNSDKLCYGYIYGPNLCNIVTSSTSIIGNNSIDRIPTQGYDTYIRNPKFPRNDNSCRKTLDATIGTDAYSYYLNNGITTNPPTTMTTQTKCNLGKVLNTQMTELKQRNNAAVLKGQEIKNQFGALFNKENQILKSISENSKTSQENDKHTTKAVNEIKRIKNAQITKSASEKDSELLLISDNYKYVILGIVSLLVSLATIKGLRMASS